MEVEKSTNGYEKLPWNRSSHSSYDIALDCMVVTTGDLFKLQDSFAERPIPHKGLNNGKMEN